MLERMLEKRIAAECAVIAALGAGEMCGRDLRTAVNAELVEQRFSRLSGPAFYQFMAEEEERGVVRAEVRPKSVEGHTIQTRWYRYTGGGTRIQRPEAQSGASDFGDMVLNPV